MNHILKPIIDLFIYSSLMISVGAFLFTYESYLLLGLSPNMAYCGLTAAATFFVYSLHRIVGIRMLDGNHTDGRFGIIRKFRHHLVVYSVTASVFAFWCVMQLKPVYILALVPAGVIAGLYVIPALGGTRIRDFRYIKIFLIASVWVYASVIVPWLSEPAGNAALLGIYLVEKFLFIMAITLPFDVRDLEVDRKQGVKTLAAVWGPGKSYMISYLLLAGGCAAGLIMAVSFLQHPPFLPFILGAYMITAVFLILSYKKTSDYYYSGWLDATIIFRSALICWILL